MTSALKIDPKSLKLSVNILKEYGTISISLLQRKLKISYDMAKEICVQISDNK